MSSRKDCAYSPSSSESMSDCSSIDDSEPRSKSHSHKRHLSSGSTKHKQSRQHKRKRSTSSTSHKQSRKDKRIRESVNNSDVSSSPNKQQQSQSNKPNKQQSNKHKKQYKKRDAATDWKKHNPNIQHVYRQEDAELKANLCHFLKDLVRILPQQQRQELQQELDAMTHRHRKSTRSLQMARLILPVVYQCMHPTNKEAPSLVTNKIVDNNYSLDTVLDNPDSIPKRKWQKKKQRESDEESVPDNDEQLHTVLNMSTVSNSQLTVTVSDEDNKHDDNINQQQQQTLRDGSSHVTTACNTTCNTSCNTPTNNNSHLRVPQNLSLGSCSSITHLPLPPFDSNLYSSQFGGTDAYNSVSSSQFAGADVAFGSAGSGPMSVRSGSNGGIPTSFTFSQPPQLPGNTPQQINYFNNQSRYFATTPSTNMRQMFCPPLPSSAKQPPNSTNMNNALLSPIQPPMLQTPRSNINITNNTIVEATILNCQRQILSQLHFHHSQSPPQSPSNNNLICDSNH